MYMFHGESQCSISSDTSDCGVWGRSPLNGQLLIPWINYMVISMCVPCTCPLQWYQVQSQTDPFVYEQ